MKTSVDSEGSTVYKPTVLVIGSRLGSDGYPRNKEILSSLKELGYTVASRSVPLPSSFHKLPLLLRVLCTLIFAPLRWIYCLASGWLYSRLKSVDVVYLPYPSHLDIPAGWLLAKFVSAPLIADIFLSVYDTSVRDRKLLDENSALAKLILSTEAGLISLPTLNVVDTIEHREIFKNLYGERADNFRIVPIAVDAEIFTHSLTCESDVVVFWGTYINLHGIDTIIRAAAIVSQIEEKINFKMIGTGQEFSKMRLLARDLGATNIIFIDRIVALSEIVEASRDAFCALGIFGTSRKSASVIPYKAVQALALGLPLITATSPATQRLFAQADEAILVNANDPQELASKILALWRDPELQKALSNNGRRVFEENFGRRPLRRIVSEVFSEALSTSPTD